MTTYTTLTPIQPPKKAWVKDRGTLVSIARFKCQRCKAVRGTRCGFDARFRFHSRNWNCQTLEALKLALRSLGKPILDDARRGLVQHYQLKLGTITALGEWKIQDERMLLAAELSYSQHGVGDYAPMRMATANKIIAEAERQMAGKYEDAEVVENPPDDLGPQDGEPAAQ